MRPQNAQFADGAQYQHHSMNPGAVNIVRLQPVPEAGCGNMQSPFVRLEPVHPHTEAQQLEVMPPVVEPWRLGPLNMMLPTLVRAFVGGPEHANVYCLKITCAQCYAAQVFPSFARVPTEEEIQHEKDGRNNEFWNYNGNEMNGLVADENGQQSGSSDRSEGSRFIYLNPDAPEFHGPQVEDSAESVESPTILNPEAPPFFAPVETEPKSSEINTQYTQNLHVQNSRQNEKRPRNRRPKQNNHPRNRSWPATNYQGNKDRGYNRIPQHHLPQNQKGIPEDAELAQMFQDTTIQLMDRPVAPYGLAPVPVAFCWTPEGGALHCMSASTGHLPPNVGRFDYRW